MNDLVLRRVLQRVLRRLLRRPRALAARTAAVAGLARLALATACSATAPPPAGPAPLTTLAEEYRRIGSGTSTLERSGKKVAAATLELADSTRACAGS